MSVFVLEVDDVSYAYPDGRQALSHICFRISPGEKVFFHGANGSGKTTLFQCLNGLLKVNKGSIKIHGNIVRKEKERMKLISIVFQNANDQIIAGSVFDEVAFGPLNMGLPKEEIIQKTEWAMSILNIAHLRDKPPHFLSYGQKKRVTIASILSMNPQIIILDEPAAGLDAEQTEELISILNQLAAKGITLLLSTHNAEFSFRCADRIIVLDDGKLIKEGKPEDVFSTTQLQKPIVMEVYEALVNNHFIERGIAYPKDVASLCKIIKQCQQVKTLEAPPPNHRKGFHPLTLP